MAYQFTKFERFLLVGLVVTGLGLATHYLQENVDAEKTTVDAKESTPPSPDREWYESKMPPLDWFVDDWFVGVTPSGERIEGQVTGYPYGDREVKILDQQSGDNRVVVLAHLKEWKIGRRPFDRKAHQMYEWHLVMPGGQERVLYGFLIEETARAFVVKLESGNVTLPKESIRQIVPVRQ